jgi:hypothetical protein
MHAIKMQSGSETPIDRNAEKEKGAKEQCKIKPIFTIGNFLRICLFAKGRLPTQTPSRANVISWTNVSSPGSDTEPKVVLVEDSYVPFLPSTVTRGAIAFLTGVCCATDCMNRVDDLLPLPRYSPLVLLSNRFRIPGLMRVEARTELVIMLDACTEDVGILRPGAEGIEVAPHMLLGTGSDSITIFGAGFAGVSRV